MRFSQYVLQIHSEMRHKDTHFLEERLNLLPIINEI